MKVFPAPVASESKARFGISDLCRTALSSPARPESPHPDNSVGWLRLQCTAPEADGPQCQTKRKPICPS